VTSHLDYILLDPPYSCALIDAPGCHYRTGQQQKFRDLIYRQPALMSLLLCATCNSRRTGLGRVNKNRFSKVMKLEQNACLVVSILSKANNCDADCRPL